MTSRYEEIDLSKIKLISIKDRKSLVDIDRFPYPAKMTREQAEKLLASFPEILAGSDFRLLIDSLRNAKINGTPRIWTMGAHPVKVGISRHIIALAEAGFITHLAVNGAFTIHDTEIACFGKTSEDVASTILDGLFAMTSETGEIINGSVKRAYEDELGLGEALGRDLLKMNQPPVIGSEYRSQFIWRSEPMSRTFIRTRTARRLARQLTAISAFLHRAYRN